MMTKVFPVAIIVLQVCAAIVYAYNGDVRRTIYWVAATALVASVTF
jgi:hypothetical protein